MLLAVLTVSGTFAAQQPERARTESLARRGADRLQALQREADALAAQERTVLGDLRKLEIDRQIKAEELQQVEAEAAAVTADLAANSERIAQLEQQESRTRPELRARLVETYKLGEARYVRLLLSATDLHQLGQATRMVAVLAKLDRDRVALHQQTLASLKTARATLQERGRRLEILKTERQRAQASADRAAAVRADLVRDIDRRRDLNAQLVGELQSAQQKLQATLKDLPSGVGADITLPLAPFRGDLDWPVTGTLARRFGRTTRDRSAASTNGIEIAAPERSAVTAIHDGTVAYADPFAGFGNLVIIDHGARSFSLYGDLLEIAVKKGARVDRGQPLGTVGSSPAGPAVLYFELRIDGQSVDPLQWLKRR